MYLRSFCKETIFFFIKLCPSFPSHWKKPYLTSLTPKNKMRRRIYQSARGRPPWPAWDSTILMIHHRRRKGYLLGWISCPSERDLRAAFILGVSRERPFAILLSRRYRSGGATDCTRPCRRRASDPKKLKPQLQEQMLKPIGAMKNIANDVG